MISDVEIKELEAKISKISDQSELKGLKDAYFGAEGKIKRDILGLKDMTASDRRLAGPQIQQSKVVLEKLFTSAAARLAADTIASKLSAEAETLAMRTPKIGHLHPITATIRKMNEFFARMGYSVYDGPEIENDEYNFQRLNVPKDHPARDMQDTIYIEAPNVLLRTHTSSVEARALATLKPPFRIVFPGRTYRNEKANKSNHFIFHQYQAVVVQEKVSLAELFGTLEMLFKHMYGDNVVMRFRNKYYPEVEPGVGPDMRCFNCAGKGCAVCKQIGWIEMGGAGIVHSHLLKSAGLDPAKWMGFAFGLGLDRWVMAKYNITDIRALLGGSLAYSYFENEKTV